MRVLSQILRVVAAVVMALVVAGFMLAFINGDAREFFLAMFIAPIALILQFASVMLDPHHLHSRHRHPEHS